MGHSLCQSAMRWMHACVDGGVLIRFSLACRSIEHSGVWGCHFEGGGGWSVGPRGEGGVWAAGRGGGRHPFVPFRPQDDPRGTCHACLVTSCLRCLHSTLDYLYQNPYLPLSPSHNDSRVNKQRGEWRAGEAGGSVLWVDRGQAPYSPRSPFTDWTGAGSSFQPLTLHRRPPCAGWADGRVQQHHQAVQNRWAAAPRPPLPWAGTSASPPPKGGSGIRGSERTTPRLPARAAPLGPLCLEPLCRPPPHAG
jgi:hypothetical protein